MNDYHLYRKWIADHEEAERRARKYLVEQEALARQSRDNKKAQSVRLRFMFLYFTLWLVRLFQPRWQHPVCPMHEADAI